MDSYIDEQRWLRHYETHKEDYEYKVMDIKKVFNIPFLYIKYNKKIVEDLIYLILFQ